MQKRLAWRHLEWEHATQWSQEEEAAATAAVALAEAVAAATAACCRFLSLAAVYSSVLIQSRIKRLQAKDLTWPTSPSATTTSNFDCR